LSSLYAKMKSHDAKGGIIMSQPTTVLYIACSLDGKIARLDGSLDWLFAVAGDGDNGYQAFYDQVGAVIMGRKTYDEVLHSVRRIRTRIFRAISIVELHERPNP